MIHTHGIAPMAVSMAMLVLAYVANASDDASCTSRLACDDENELLSADVSLLQTDVHVHNKMADRSASKIAEKPHGLNEGSVDPILVGVDDRKLSADAQAQTQDQRLGSGESSSQAMVLSMLVAHESANATKLAPSAMARNIAWLHHVGNTKLSNGIVWILLVPITILAVVVMLMLSASESRHRQMHHSDVLMVQWKEWKVNQENLNRIIESRARQNGLSLDKNSTFVVYDSLGNVVLDQSKLPREEMYWPMKIVFARKGADMYGGQASQLLLPPSPTPIQSQSLLHARSTSTDPRLSPMPASVPFPTEPVRQSIQGKAVGLPPIAQNLILPHTEARFMIDMASLLGGGLQAGIDILGTSGRKLLHASISSMPDGSRILNICSVGCEDDPRTVVMVPAHGPPDVLEIYGKAGKKYGVLDCSGGTLARLQYMTGVDHQTVLQISMQQQESLSMVASTMDDATVAEAGKDMANAGSRKASMWGLKVKPNVDAVLITSCMLSLILMRPWPASRGLFSSFPLSPSATTSSLRPATSSWV